MGKLGDGYGAYPNRALLRTLVWAVLLAFALLLAYRFLAKVTTVALVTGYAFALLALLLVRPLALGVSLLGSRI